VSDEHRRRWDTDERGHGLSSASAYVPAISELAELASTADWVTEDPEAHLLPGLRRGAEASGLTITSFATDPEGCFAVHFKGAGSRSRREVREAVWAIIGGVAELSTHVREVKTEGDVVFEVVTGTPEGAGSFATHGHTLRLVVDAAD
jgi:hypothetical protein